MVGKEGGVGNAVRTEQNAPRSNQSTETQLQALIHSLRAVHYGL